MSLSLLLIVVPLVAALGVALDRVAGRRLGWLLPIAVAGYAGWPRGSNEQNVYGYFLGAVVAGVLLIAYGIVAAWMARTS